VTGEYGNPHCLYECTKQKNYLNGHSAHIKKKRIKKNKNLIKQDETQLLFVLGHAIIKNKKFRFFMFCLTVFV